MLIGTRMINVIVGYLLLWMTNCSGFLPPSSTVLSLSSFVRVPTTRTIWTAARRRNPSRDEDGEEYTENKEIPQLPSYGTSSFDERAAVQRKLLDQQDTTPAFVGRKFELQYTCKICETRNIHKVSRIGKSVWEPWWKLHESVNHENHVILIHPLFRIVLVAYQKGVVITVCKGCMSQHLISDNLGFTQQFDGNIEDYFKEKGQEDNVNRVSEDVFNLERILGLDTKSGSIFGNDGTAHLE